MNANLIFAHPWALLLLPLVPLPLWPRRRDALVFPGNRIGWGVFAEYRTLLLLAPLEVCEHYHDLLASLAHIDGRMRWGNASQVTKGLLWALRSARELRSTPDVVFITDGHEATPLRSKDTPAFDDVKPGEVRGWILGVDADAPRPIPRTDADGRRIGVWRANEVVQPDEGGSEHLSSLHEPHLRGLARHVGLEYARLAQPGVLAGALRDVRFARSEPAATDLSAVPVAAALCLLVLHLLPRGWRR